MMIVSKWKCEICGKEFDNFHAQGFEHKIYCPLCFFKEKTNRLEKENARLKDKIKDLEEWLEAMASMYENEYKDVNASEHYKCMLYKLKENQAIIKNIKINNKIII